MVLRAPTLHYRLGTCIWKADMFCQPSALMDETGWSVSIETCWAHRFCYIGRSFIDLAFPSLTFTRAPAANMTLDQSALSEPVREKRSLNDLPDDILRDIADLLEPKRQWPDPPLQLPTYESPRPFALRAKNRWRPCSQPASLPGRIRIAADVRALRVVCRRTAQAPSLAYFTDFVLNIETMADINVVREAPHTVRMAAR